jgi:hypothetical protein
LLPRTFAASHLRNLATSQLLAKLKVMEIEADTFCFR